jgi:uncharacterized protein (DUF58 family)
MPVPTWRLALAAAGGAVVVLVAPVRPATALLVVNLGLLAVAVADWLAAPRAARLGVARSVAHAVALETEDEIAWTVTNPTGRALALRLADQLPPSLRAARRRVALRVPARARASARVAIRPARRGRFDLERVTVRVDGPLGLAARQGRVSVRNVLRVYPPFASRREAELRLTRVAQEGLRSVRGRGGGTDFDALREYTVDDEFRRIDWAATARARKPIVRTYRPERNQTVLVLLDSGRTMAGRVGDVPRLDHGMDAAMLLVTLATGLGDRAGLVAFADRVRAVVAPSHQRDQLRVVTEALYTLEPGLVESDYSGAFTHTLARFRRRALLVVLTELAQQAVEETLIPALPLVTRSHLVIVGAVRDPAVERWAQGAADEVGEAYRAAAAVEALAQRRETAARLRALGAVVVDALPGRLAPELGDAYLRIKGAGRL